MGILQDLFQSLSGSPEETPAVKRPAGFSAGYASFIGYVRQANEDDFYVDTIGTRSDPETEGQTVIPETRMVAAVCDGMGGEAFGAEAAQIGAETIAKYAPRLNEAPVEALSALVHDCVKEANDRICEMVASRGYSRSGCTMVLAVCVDKLAYIYSLGDSRVYSLQNGILTQLTEDQTLAQQKLKARIYTEEEARQSPDHHSITAFLGVDDQGEGLEPLEYPPVDMRGTTLLLCSDGLTDMCSDGEIKEILSAGPAHPARALVRAALAHGGVDNTTCVVLGMRSRLA